MSVYYAFVRRLASWTLSLCLLAGVYPAWAVEDALNDPAQQNERAAQGLLLGMTQIGPRLFAVGERGHILYSDDQGRQWQQAQVPVRVTLTAIHFADNQRGWAVGHDGVILNTTDGGLSWSKQFDGLQANQLIEIEVQRLLEQAEASGEPTAGYSLDDLYYLLDDVQLFSDEGASRPFMDIHFSSADQGIALGAYGMLFRTEDGGENWQPWMSRLNNPNNRHFNAIAGDGQTLYIAGESGSLYRSDDAGENWQALSSPYDGPFFGLLHHKNNLIAYGLRGNAFLSTDGGQSWQALTTHSDASLFGAAALDQGRFVLLSAAGELFQFDAEGQPLGRALAPGGVALSNAIYTNDNNLILVGMGGAARMNLDQMEWQTQ